MDLSVTARLKASVVWGCVPKAHSFQLHRKTKKREYRGLWITRINAAARMNGTTYSVLIAGLEKRQIMINRKVLADLAVHHPNAFSEVVKFATS